MAIAIAGYPYNIRSAVNDIVDNPIENGASRIAVLLKETGAWEKGAVVVVDDGTGVDPDILDEVLRPGSYTADRYSENSLSRYGIGLKGAGLSLGNRITVLTKFAGEPLRRRAIDMKQIQETDQWFQEIREPNKVEGDYFDWAMAQLPGGARSVESGTVVIIDDLNIRSSDSNKMTREVIRTCGETYARFLSSQVPNDSRIQISVDGQLISPVDPLHRENKGTTVLYDREQIMLENGVVMHFSAALLPHPNQVDAETKKRYRYLSENQGIYVYRNSRLIAKGQTLGLFVKDGHLNAFRAELVYSTNGDENVLVDVAKSAVVLSPEATSKLQELINNCTKAAQTLWRRYDILTEEDIKGLFDESNRLIESRIKLLPKKPASKTGDVGLGKGEATNAARTKPPSRKKDINYLVPVETLPDGMLYCPRFEDGSVQVEVNLSHPLSKAVFSGSASETKKNVPRKPTTAVQQLIYVLGSTEYMFPDENLPLFEQFRRYASLNLSGLLAD